MNPAPATLTASEAQLLIIAIAGSSTNLISRKKGVRNVLIACLMLDAGLRVGEVVKLERCDLVLNDEPVTTLRIRGPIAKRGKERLVPLTTRLQALIREMQIVWLDGPGNSQSPHAFCNSGKASPISTRQVERIVKSAGKTAIGRPVHPHILRHTFASRLMRTTSIRVVQTLLGHQNLSSTQIYTHPNGDDLQNAIKSLETPPANAC